MSTVPNNDKRCLWGVAPDLDGYGGFSCETHGTFRRGHNVDLRVPCKGRARYVALVRCWLSDASYWLHERLDYRG